MAEPAILLSRNADDSLVNPMLIGKPLVLGEILFKSYATSSNPTNEVLSSTVDAGAGHVVSLNALDTTIVLTAGTIQIPRTGKARVKWTMGQVSSASASGVMTFEILQNAAALTKPCKAKLLQPAVVNNFMSAQCEQVIAVTAGDLISVRVTGTVGGVITVEEALLSVEMLADATVPAQSRV